MSTGVRIFLVDQQLPRKLVAWLRSHGCEAAHVLDLDLEHGEDIEIWGRGKALGAVIISKDEDFSFISARAVGPQVVWLRMGNCSNDRLLGCLSESWPRIVAELEAGTPLIEIR